MSTSLFAEYEGLFRCPVCCQGMKLAQDGVLACAARHAFDIARKGYVNFLSRPIRSKYDKQLFESRLAVGRSGFFDPLYQRIAAVLIDRLQMQRRSSPVFMLDAGCGEGFHSAALRRAVSRKSPCDPVGVGLDISKEGIRIAAREHPEMVWCVADLARCPIADGRIDIILNVLSPSNYGEFERVLAFDGTVVKVIPGGEYLLELRSLLYGKPPAAADSGRNVVELFYRHFVCAGFQRIRYEVTPDAALTEHLVRMTPLSWGAEEERLQRAIQDRPATTTVDFTILFGKKK